MARRGANVMLDAGAALRFAPALDVTNDVLAALNASAAVGRDDRAGAAAAAAAAGPVSEDEHRRRHRPAGYPAGDGGAAASLPDAAGRPGRADRARPVDHRDQGGDDQRGLLPGAFPRPADHARRADRRGAGPGRRRARGRKPRPRRTAASWSISWRSKARSSARRSSPACLLQLEVEFVQKRASVCKFAGRALVDGKLAAEAQFHGDDRRSA